MSSNRGGKQIAYSLIRIVCITYFHSILIILPLMNHQWLSLNHILSLISIFELKQFSFYKLTVEIPCGHLSNILIKEQSHMKDIPPILDNYLLLIIIHPYWKKKFVSMLMSWQIKIISKQLPNNVMKLLFSLYFLNLYTSIRLNKKKSLFSTVISAYY